MTGQVDRNEEGACATQSFDMVGELPMFSIVIVFFWALVIQYGPLLRA